MKSMKFLVVYLIVFVLFIILNALGNIERKGYLGNFNINETDNDIVEGSNEYIYSFRVKYYNKIFKNSDIYSVHIEYESLPDYVKKIRFSDFGGPFGKLLSTKELSYDGKIDNVSYKLKLKPVIYLYFILFLLVYTLYLSMKNKEKIKQFFLKKSFNEYCRLFFRIYGIFLIFSFIIMCVLYFLGHRSYSGKIGDFELIYESNAGYVYRGKVLSDGLFSANMIYKISDKPLIIDDIPDYIKNYGYNIEINRIPDAYDTSIATNWQNSVDSFTVSNSTNWNAYNVYMLISPEEVYEVNVDARRVSGKGGAIAWYLDYYNNYKVIDGSSNISDTYSNFIDSRVISKPKYRNNSSLYFRFPEGDVEIKSIVIKFAGDDFIAKEKNTVIVTSLQKLNYFDSIDNIKYSLSFNRSIIIASFIIIILFLILKFIYYYKIINNFFSYKKVFIPLTLILSLIFILFQFWVGFPGYFQNVDNYLILEQSTGELNSNMHPIIIALSLRFLYFLFGYHTFYLFLINLICWYLGLSLLIISLDWHFNKKIVLLLFLLSFISNIFFQNFTQLKDVTMSMYIWFSLSLVFFQIIIPIKIKLLNISLKILTGIIMFLALLWRHNAIVSVYPFFILFTFLLLKNKKFKSIKKYLLSFFSYMILFAFLLIFTVKFYPYIWLNKDEVSFPTTMIYMLDIVACSVLSNDDTLIPDNWYFDGKNYDDIKKMYYKNPLWIDYILDGYINAKIVTNAKDKWFESVLKHPISYLKQRWLMFKGFTLGFPGYIFDSYNISGIADYRSSRIEILKTINDRVLVYFPENEHGIFFSKIRNVIYNNLYNRLIQIKFIFSFCISFIIMVISGYIFIFKNNFKSLLLVLSFCAAFSSVATTFLVVFITISCDVRYIFPILPMSIISLISFITFFCDKSYIKAIKVKN